MSSDPSCLPDSRVGIVLHENYGDKLLALLSRMSVWVVDTPANLAAARTIWASRPDRYAMPVTFAGRVGTVEVLLKRLPGMSEGLKCDALHPGIAAPRSIQPPVDDPARGFLRLVVPVTRGCAMVRLRHSP